ncbi:MAG: thioredoxin [Candidatus Woykebacteria bacterium RIFCSPHIGHO2_12_FULL_43_10]|uniref:Thioredoxin n=2 Tax=Candidatus Woykeibacteriota TaxID=1817899 RepID=A0A1G1WUK6_9BACT|nr:MAG: thioredoxin [Candidatus Woykebacteria bacterium RIFCSPHIGHO2_01_FULL_43_29]OGY28798.1 MAG: thioredoxin [Candidatus Woykebacteria bacterium RIFCSPHIGHO2_02_FULL_43_16b]OGY30047.1 MAG: thioredoxin [Candidatus Woykebacteria bacterium RIFCSPHIGHO2_12_FULL_43_10]OGY30857.1 MAG: thioredoxin [Candidatus Woykebacteria bacterium RIFCSPLOWO2_01_FULL_43_14]
MIEVLKFYADWCTPCHVLSPIMDEIEKELGAKVTIKKIDVDADNNTAMKYGVLSIPTLVLIKDGKEVDRIVGLASKEAIQSKLSPHLA